VRALINHVLGGLEMLRTGLDTTLPDELVKECAETVAATDEMLRMPGVCGPAVTVGDDASTQDKLIAFMGRRP
jgi:hypothetical protein